MEILNGLMEVHDGANSLGMQDVLCHSQLSGLAIGKVHMCVCSQKAREAEATKLWALNENIIGVRGDVNPFEFKI